MKDFENDLESVVIPAILKELKKNFIFGGTVNELKRSYRDKKYEKVKEDFLPLYEIEDEIAESRMEIAELFDDIGINKRRAERLLFVEPHEVWFNCNEYLFNISGSGFIFFLNEFPYENITKDYKNIQKRLSDNLKEKLKTYTLDDFIKTIKFDRVVQSLNKIFEPKYGIRISIDKRETKRKIKPMKYGFILTFDIQCIFNQDRFY